VIPILGRIAVLIALAACGVGAVCGIAGGMKRNEQAWRWSRIMAYTAFAAMTASIVLMEYALITNDFSVSYVAEVGSTKTPLWVTMVSLWSSLDGSILLWGLVLTGYIATFAWKTKGKFQDHASWALGISLMIGVFFTFLVSGIANPFEAMDPVPTEGPGPNPLLQNHILMIIHPPALYLGYVGMAVPFGMGCASLLVGRIGPAWSQAIRRWMLLPWGFLTIGIMLGGWWSYEVLGWGGYWAWDPVENASFLPWLTATAFIHSSVIMERKDTLKGWAITLLLATFLLTLLGTFMTRSGVFNSVHSFTQTPIGPVFLGFLAFSSIMSLILLAVRIDVLSPSDERKKSSSAISRDSMFLANNLLFSAFTFTVLIGTIYPLIHEAMTEKKLSIGEPYFNELGVPISIGIVFLMGVGPALPWGRVSLQKAINRLQMPLIFAFVIAGISWALGARDFLPLLSFWTCGFALQTTLRELYEPAKMRSIKKGEAFIVSLKSTLWMTRRRTGGYINHIGVIMIAASVTGSSAYKQQKEVVLKPGESVQVEEYKLTYVEDKEEKQPHRSSRLAVISVERNDSDLGLLMPRLNNYYRMGSTIGTPAVKTSLDEDLYLNLVNINTDGSIIGLQVILEPMILWLWLGGGVMGLGTVISLWPTRRRRSKTNIEETA
jgi:cytochrome c-type biogenesis protein CcmF